ncbi:MAG: hypothetical protein JOY78_00200 [Pseudonocardia sp.]|nr:hypothetical protein [Pseudonocardia sp.]
MTTFDPDGVVVTDSDESPDDAFAGVAQASNGHETSTAAAVERYTEQQAQKDDSNPQQEVEELDADWPYERLDFAGDRLAIRKPTMQALSGFSLASSKYVSMDVKNDITGLFISQHMGPESYGRMMMRLMDGDDPDYTTETVGEIMKAIVQASLADKADKTDKS